MIMLLSASSNLYILPAKWANALTKLDISGLDENEHGQLISWVKEVDPGMCLGVVDAQAEFELQHDASALDVEADMCLTYVFQPVH